MNSRANKPRVLLVEDDPAQLALISARFRSAKFEFETASDGHQALSLMKDRRFGIVVADIELPGLSGLDLLRSLRGQTPVILISGAITPTTRAKAIDEGAVAVFKKPVGWKDLLEEVDKVCKSGARPPRALVADDHPATRALLREVLQREGFHVDEAADGEEAVEKALATTVPYDLLITDILMPKLNGPEVIREIRKINKRVRIVFTTGAGTRREIRDCYLGGAVSLWRKPFDLKMVVEHLRKFKAEPIPQPDEHSASNVFEWVSGFRDSIEKDKKKKMALRKAGLLVVLFILSAIIVESLVHVDSLLGGTWTRLEHFMQRVEGYLEWDEGREIEREFYNPGNR